MLGQVLGVGFMGLHIYTLLAGCGVKQGVGPACRARRDVGRLPHELTSSHHERIVERRTETNPRPVSGPGSSSGPQAGGGVVFSAAPILTTEARRRRAARANGWG